MYIPKPVHEENVHNNYLMGLIFSTSWRVDPTKKNSLWGSGFLAFCTQKHRILRKEFLRKLLVFSENSFKGISFLKLTPLYFFEQKIEFFSNFDQRDFFWKIDPGSHPGLVLHVLCTSHPRLVLHVLCPSKIPVATPG